MLHDGDVEHAAGDMVIILRPKMDETSHIAPARGGWPRIRHDYPRRMVAPGAHIGQPHDLAPGFAVHHPGMATQPVGQVGNDVA
jgi:hypothetical protein